MFIWIVRRMGEGETLRMTLRFLSDLGRMEMEKQTLSYGLGVGR